MDETDIELSIPENSPYAEALRRKKTKGECGDRISNALFTLVCVMPKGHGGTHGDDNQVRVEFNA